MISSIVLSNDYQFFHFLLLQNIQFTYHRNYQLFFVTGTWDIPVPRKCLPVSRDALVVAQTGVT
ncbi:MAG: hypothetical protein KAT31_04990 [Bacteroidales bacterium]|nr:hypothetical protein [Bacteroidales bacterium]